MAAPEQEIRRCVACGRRLYRPRSCGRCGGAFCTKHINPRAHGCLPPRPPSRYLTPRTGAVLLVVAAVLVAIGLYGQSRPRPGRVHLSWQNDPETTMTVVWWTSKAGPGRVRYGRVLLDRSVTATSEPFDDGYLNFAKIDGLEPDTKYRYKCGTKGEWSRTAAFKTAPEDDASASFSFSFLCDSRSQREPRRKVADLVRRKGGDLIIDAGDLVSNGDLAQEWRDWFWDMRNTLSDVSFMPVVGNHEHNSELYYKQFALPSGEEYYSFDYANTHFVALNTEIQLDGAQASWLEEDLRRARNDPDIVWIVAFFHQPIFTASSHAGRQDVAAVWGPLMDRYHVDLVLAGHNHCYERTSALLSNGTITDRGRNLVNPAGTVHVTAGGAGAPLYESRGAPFIEHARSVYHFVRIEVNGRQMELRAMRDDGSTFDTLTVKKA